jgi:Ras family
MEDRTIGGLQGRCWCMISRGLRRLLRPRHGCLIFGPMRTPTLPSVQPDTRTQLTSLVLVGNKADLSHDRKVTTEEARQWARENDVSVCVESSAKSGDGVEDAFQRVAEEVFRKIRDGVFDLSDKVRWPGLWLLTLDSRRGSRLIIQRIQR